MTRPLVSTTVASAGIFTSEAGPAATIRPPSTTTAA